jgi:head-tail adaptor
MRGGRLRSYVTIERPTYTADSYGERIEGSPTVLGPFWAAIEPLSSRELEVSRQQRSDVTHRIFLRAGDGLMVRATDRIRLGTRTFEPTGDGIDVDERHRQILFQAVEVRDQGT